MKRKDVEGLNIYFSARPLADAAAMSTSVRPSKRARRLPLPQTVTDCSDVVTRGDGAQLRSRRASA